MYIHIHYTQPTSFTTPIGSSSATSVVSPIVAPQGTAPAALKRGKRKATK